MTWALDWGVMTVQKNIDAHIKNVYVSFLHIHLGGGVNHNFGNVK